MLATVIKNSVIKIKSKPIKSNLIKMKCATMAAV